MRLRLIIRRNGLPDAHILWNSTGLHNASSHNSTRTIADFLQEVDDVIPLESEDRGIEDYVVEVSGFECVHFSVLDNILKEDDEVVIRPITINDSRFRRVSGRVQIAADGRRLFDGVAFGRPFVRKASRPPVRTPWAKRARITYDEESQVQSASSNQLVLQDEDSDDEDDEEDSDYSGEMSAEEIADLAAESAAYEREIKTLGSPASRKRKRTGLGIQAIDHETPRITSVDSNTTWRQGQGSVRKGLRESPKSVRFEGEELDTPVTVLAIDSSEDSDDDDAESSENESEPFSPEADKENIAPGRLVRTPIVSQSSQITDTSSVEADETTSSSGSDTGSESDSSDTESTSAFEPSDESSESDESSSQSTSESIASTKLVHQTASTVSTEKQTALVKGLAEQPKATSSAIVSPGQGKRDTKKRNERRKRKQQFDRLKSLDLSSTSQAESYKAIPDESQADDTSHKTSEEIGMNDLEKRKAALLQNLDMPSTDILEEDTVVSPIGGNKVPSVNNDDNSMVVQQHETLESSPSPQELSSKLDASGLQNDLEGKIPEQKQSSIPDQESPIKSPEINREQQQTPRRAKLDIGSAKRMLFGSLGLRAPKSKNDADKLREDLREKARQLPGYLLGHNKAKENPPVPVPEIEIQNDESWRDKIDLQAVECCYDNITYSKPSFPFVQRWDPQQQYQIDGRRKRGQGKRKERDNKIYYQDRYENEGYFDYGNHQEMGDEDPNEESRALDYDGEMEQSNSDIHAANDQLLGEMQAESIAIEKVADLPALPANMSSLEILTQDTALPGCIIAFKQMEMSEQTQWSPLISGYRTARIEAILESGVLEVVLAARDVQQKQKNYDSRTGQRIYAKFEMPVDEEEGEDDDERRLEIGLQDMIEPKLVQAAENQAFPYSFSSTIKTAVDTIQDALTVGKEITTAILNPVVQNEAPVELDSAIEPDLTSTKFEKSEKTSQAHQVSTTTSMTEPTLVASQEYQPALPADESLSRWREASIELGSQNPPQRFFSEIRSGLISDRMDDTVPSAIGNDSDIQIIMDDKAVDAEVSGLKHDDPSIWANETENNDNDESTRFYSLSDGQNNDLSSSNLSHEAIAKDITINADLSNDYDDSVIVHPRDEDLPLPSVAQAQDDVESSLFVDDDPLEVDPADQNSASAGNESEDDTIFQDSMGKDKLSTKITSTANLENSDPDSDSGSLLSLKDILSQPIVSSPKPSRVGNRKPKKSTYPKIPSATPEDADSFVFSQAPKRVFSNNEKMVADLETGSFLGSDDLEDTNEPYELEAHVADEVVPKTEVNEPQLPSILIPHEMDNRSGVTRSNRLRTPVFQGPSKTKRSGGSGSNATDDMVIDLTLSSDPVESNDNSISQVMSTTGSMPSGPGWVDKPARNVKAKAKTYSKSPRSSIRRKKSIV